MLKPGKITDEMYLRAKKIIPGGTQLLSKRPEMMAPEQWPAYFREARGCEIWDLDGRHYYDMYTNSSVFFNSTVNSLLSLNTYWRLPVLIRSTALMTRFSVNL